MNAPMPLFATTQGYILSGHNRSTGLYGLFHFKSDDQKKLRAAFEELAAQVTSAPDLRAGLGDPNLVVTAAGFSWPGFQKLGLDRPYRFSHEFKRGFAERVEQVTGVGTKQWGEPWQPENRYDALVILAAGLKETRGAQPVPADRLLSPKRQLIEKQFAQLATITWIEGYVDVKDGGAIEHFKFQDGISQPIFFPTQGLIPEHPISKWNPNADGSLVLVGEPYPANPNPNNEYGSYMAFLKIQQNTDAFAEASRSLACKLHSTVKPTEEDELNAKEQIIGRHKDGMPLVGQDRNDFDHDTDPQGRKWPFASHVRKMNPRNEPARRIARRSMLYQETDKEGKESRGVLFQCFQASLGEQFEFIFRNWANNSCHPVSGCGVDPLVGHDPSNSPQQWPKPNAGWTVPQRVNGLTTVKGGEYFYLPSVPSLRNLTKLK